MSSLFRRARGASSVLVAAAAVALAVARAGAFERIHVVGTGFRTASGRPAWLNGINTAWIRWNDFGLGRFDATRWDEEFQRYAAVGINCARVWLDCDGEVAVAFDGDGFVAGPAAGFTDDVAALLEIAARHRVHVIGVLMSFDHVKPTHVRHRQWRRVFNDDACRDSYLRRFLDPVARQFAEHPALLAWEICNEPEWIWVRRFGVPRDRVIAFHAHAASALHAAGASAVTTGSASWRWHADRGRTSAGADHPWSDASLRRHVSDPGARLDFFQVHYYDWMALLGWSPYAIEATPARFLRVVDRPVIIGETRGRYSWITGRTVEETYRRGSVNGYAGVFGWSAHGSDGHGNFEEIAAATRALAGYGDALAERTAPRAGEGRGLTPLESNGPENPANDPNEAVERIAMAESLEPATRSTDLDAEAHADAPVRETI